MVRRRRRQRDRRKTVPGVLDGDRDHAAVQQAHEDGAAGHGGRQEQTVRRPGGRGGGCGPGVDRAPCGPPVRPRGPYGRAVRRVAAAVGRRVAAADATVRPRTRRPRPPPVRDVRPRARVLGVRAAGGRLVFPVQVPRGRAGRGPAGPGLGPRGRPALRVAADRRAPGRRPVHQPAARGRRAGNGPRRPAGRPVRDAGQPGLPVRHGGGRRRRGAGRGPGHGGAAGVVRPVLPGNGQGGAAAERRGGGRGRQAGPRDGRREENDPRRHVDELQRPVPGTGPLAQVQERSHILRDRVRRAHAAVHVPGVPRAHRRRQSQVRDGHHGRVRDGRLDATRVERGQRPGQLCAARLSMNGSTRPRTAPVV